MSPTRRSLLAAAGGSLFLAAGCSSGNGSNPSPGAATGTGAGATSSAGTASSATGDMITIQNFAFSPANLTVAAGTSITVANKDSTTHTVTSSASPKAFDTGDVPGGASTTFKAPAKPGTYAYSCTIHPFMHGTLTVH